jgi:hypothetical protein
MMFAYPDRILCVWSLAIRPLTTYRKTMSTGRMQQCESLKATSQQSERYTRDHGVEPAKKEDTNLKYTKLKNRMHAGRGDITHQVRNSSPLSVCTACLSTLPAHRYIVLYFRNEPHLKLSADTPCCNFLRTYGCENTTAPRLTAALTSFDVTIN